MHKSKHHKHPFFLPICKEQQNQLRTKLQIIVRILVSSHLLLYIKLFNQPLTKTLENYICMHICSKTHFCLMQPICTLNETNSSIQIMYHEGYAFHDIIIIIPVLPHNERLIVVLYHMLNSIHLE